VFPYGIEIGNVTEATLDEQQTYQRVHVEPFVDMREVEIVSVLTRPGGGGDSRAENGGSG
jgi:cell shape-determining protein MreC